MGALMNLGMRRVLSVVWVCGGVSMASSAVAALPPPCLPAKVVPSGVASIPANLPGFGYTALKGKQEDLTLTALSGPSAGQVVPLTVGPVEGGLLKVVPASPLTEGTTYQFTFNSYCSYSAYPAPPAMFTVVPAAPLPTQIGTLTTGPSFSLKDYGTTKLTMSSTYSLAAEMKPWVRVFELNVVFDGKMIETDAQFNGSSDTVQLAATAWCDAASAGLSKHTVSLRARLPFTTPLETPATELAFECPAPDIRTPPNNPPVPPSQARGAEVQSPAAQPVSTTTSGCAASPGAGSAWSAGALVGLALIIARRRRGAAAATRRA